MVGRAIATGLAAALVGIGFGGSSAPAAASTDEAGAAAALGVAWETGSTGPTLLRGPYLQVGTDSSIIIRWRTDVPASSRVLYGDAPGNLTFVEQEPGETTEHEVTLSGLDADTRYYYAVGDDVAVLAGGDPDHSFVTAPLAGVATPTRIWVVGDSGTGDANAMAVRDAYAAFAGTAQTDLWLMLGDNAYQNGTDVEYQERMFELFPEMLRRSVVWPTPGNHDVGGVSGEIEAYYDVFTLPASGEAGGVASGSEAYYSFDHGNVHFVVLDSAGSFRTTGSPMLAWLEQDLAATASDWIVAYWHHPPYSKGSHDSDVELALIEMRQYVVPILEDYGVDLVFNGHSHSYERSFLLDGHYGGSDTLAPEMILDGGDGRSDGDGVYWKPSIGPSPHEGAVYTVAGCGGQISGGALDHPAMLVSLNSLGSLVLDVDDDRIDMSFLTDAGQIADRFTMVKGCADSPLSFGSRDAASGNESSIFTPGLCDGGPPCTSDIDSSVSSGLTGAFWLNGRGDPAVGAGIDSGSYLPLEPDGAGWVTTEPGLPAYVEGGLAVELGMDGCAQYDTDGECMTLVLGDQHDAEGYFAVMSSAPDASGNYRFDQPAGAPIELSPIPIALILTSEFLGDFTVRVDVVTDEPTEGLFLDDAACPTSPFVGYRVYQQDTRRYDPPPVDRSTDAGWTLADGGELPSGAPIPFGQQTSVWLTCPTASNFYLASTLVFEDGFELPIVSESRLWVLCSNCQTDDDLDGYCGIFVTGAPGADCDDTNRDVYPGAPQLCGDLLNNDCNHPSWPELTGTDEFDHDGDGVTVCQGDCNDDDALIWGVTEPSRSLHVAADKTTVQWVSPPPEAAPGSVRHDLLRSPLASDFDAAASCIATDIDVVEVQDFEQPEAGGVFFYLARPRNECGPGPMGATSSGVPRSGRDCP